MRSALPILAAVFLAGAADAVELPFTGTLTFEFSYLGLPITVAGSGVATVNGSGAGGTIVSLGLPGGTFDTTGQIVPVTDPAAAPIEGIGLTVENGPAAFGPSGGVMPLAGYAFLCMFAPCAAAVANLTVPLEVVGVGGSETFMGAALVTVIGAPWTTGTASIGALTRMGFVGGPASNPSTAGTAGGHIQLVTPILIYSNLGVDGAIPAFATLTLHFVPEPVSFVLLGSGIAALALARRRTARR